MARCEEINPTFIFAFKAYGVQVVMKIIKCWGLKNKSKIKTVWQTIVDSFGDYSNHSTIHGVSYIGEKGRSWFERTWWIAAICVSVVCCTKLIIDAWNIDPIIISFKETPTSIWQVSGKGQFRRSL
jgi:Amiloride-sensitive sodium channel